MAATVAGSVLLFLGAIGAAFALAGPPSPIAAADLLFESLAIRFFTPPRPPSDRIVIIGLDEDTLSLMSYRSPLDRAFLARLIETLSERGVRAIGLDIVFDQATEPDKDRMLETALREVPTPVVIGSIARETALSPAQRRYLDAFVACCRHGYTNLARDMFDGMVRLHIPRDGNGSPSFAAALAEVAGGKPPARPFRIDWRPAARGATAFPIYPAQLVPSLPAAWLKDRIALVGLLIPGQDEHLTPLTVFAHPMFGVEIHAHALAQILDGAALAAPSPWIERGAVAAAAAIGMALVAVNDSVLPIAAVTVLIAAIWAGALAAFSIGAPLVAPLAPTLALSLGAGGARSWRGWLERRDRKVLMQLFSRFVGEPIVREFWKERDSFLDGGHPRPLELTATVLFSDIAGFTPICEALPPAPLIAWLDRYIDAMVDVVAAHDGVVLRFIGDGILAAFGAPVARRTEAEIDRDARNAVQSALAMVAAMQQLNAAWAAEGLPTAGIRIGIFTGPLVAGSLGSGAHMEYCLLGDTANTASRLEAQGKQHVDGPQDCVILVGEPTWGRLDGRFRAAEVGSVSLRGKRQPVGVYRILGAAD
ncbi:adenylate/guanylate cyclase domain-containing protein [Aliidongia dinghuensis]|uniref:Adenylate/guanylate cyclase domain-containing protein n=1 Tax=Aliidongia dinghuensis TaxID=1867774 RepID=A0A8J3E1U8_9PROT|nr:adenylate/guanylate cyclase domain-containing protein [Aliidongia dinghuensis]GGF15383.1 adenylate/guanylate cyclase domain-containing protein [Aliidongia dinghuensis]